MEIFENETRFDPLIELNHLLHKVKRSQLLMAWNNLGISQQMPRFTVDPNLFIM